MIHHSGICVGWGAAVLMFDWKLSDPDTFSQSRIENLLFSRGDGYGEELVGLTW